MRSIKNVLWGLVFIAAGVVIALNILDIIDFDFFFAGWWTLFIIIPATIGLFERGPKSGNIIAIFIGVALLLAAQNIIDFSTVVKLCLPIVLIVIGISIIFKKHSSEKVKERIIEINKDTEGEPNKSECSAIFSGENISFDGQVFNGAELNSVFGNIKCDLRGSVISQDVVINANAVFGGITILLPEDVNLKIHSSSVFGGVSNKKKNSESEITPTVYVKADCMFGGVNLL